MSAVGGALQPSISRVPDDVGREEGEGGVDSSAPKVWKASRTISTFSCDIGYSRQPHGSEHALEAVGASRWLYLHSLVSSWGWFGSPQPKPRLASALRTTMLPLEKMSANGIGTGQTVGAVVTGDAVYASDKPTCRVVDRGCDQCSKPGRVGLQGCSDRGGVSAHSKARHRGRLETYAERRDCDVAGGNPPWGLLVTSRSRPVKKKEPKSPSPVTESSLIPANTGCPPQPEASVWVWLASPQPGPCWRAASTITMSPLTRLPTSDAIGGPARRGGAPDRLQGERVEPRACRPVVGDR